MSRALKGVCEELGLISVVDDPATRTIAKKIIECAQRGVHDADTLRAFWKSSEPRRTKFIHTAFRRAAACAMYFSCHLQAACGSTTFGSAYFT
jgi:hypothetical protein